MVSLVVCSVNPNYLASLKKNVDEKIGVEHEWLVWDNSHLNLGLCEVYNRMAEKSKFPYICFLHEDVLIETLNWGTICIDICTLQSISLLGVAGGKYKSKLLSGWYSGGKNLDFFHVIQENNGVREKLFIPDKWDESEQQVASLDGLFLFCDRKSWEKTKFNEKLLKGFHYYDIDFSLRIAQHAKVAVTNQIDITHFSAGGNYGDAWVEQTIVYHNHIKAMLPFSVAESVEPDIDIIVAKYWLDWLKNMKISSRNRVRWVNIQKLYKYPALYYSIAKFFLYKPLGLRAIHHTFKRLRSK